MFDNLNPKSGFVLLRSKAAHYLIIIISDVSYIHLIYIHLMVILMQIASKFMFSQSSCYIVPLLLEKRCDLDGSCGFSQTVLTIAKIMTFNFKRLKVYKSKTRLKRNCHQFETPISIFLGLNILNKSRNRSLIDGMHKLGLCLSYKWVINITDK